MGERWAGTRLRGCVWLPCWRGAGSWTDQGCARCALDEPRCGDRGGGPGRLRRCAGIRRCGCRDRPVRVRRAGHPPPGGRVAAPGRCASAGTARRRSVRGAALPGRRVHRPPRGRQRADHAPLPAGRIRSQLPSPIPGAGASRRPEPSARRRAGAAGADPQHRRQPAHLRFRTRLGGRVHPGRMAGGCRGQGLADTPVARYSIAADLPLAHGRDPAARAPNCLQGTTVTS